MNFGERFKIADAIRKIVPARGRAAILAAAFVVVCSVAHAHECGNIWRNKSSPPNSLQKSVGHQPSLACSPFSPAHATTIWTDKILSSNEVTIGSLAILFVVTVFPPESWVRKNSRTMHVFRLTEVDVLFSSRDRLSSATAIEPVLQRQPVEQDESSGSLS